MQTEWIDKIEVVNRQIREAVRLFFEQRDSVAIHTIIASAHQILFDLGRAKGIESSIKNTAALRRNEIQEFLKNINYPHNFFKHADKDPDSPINVAPLERLTADFIMDAIVMLQRLSGAIPIEGKVYGHWFISKFKEEFDNLPDDSEIRKMQQVNLAGWDFPTISQFLKFCEVLGIEGAANKTLKP